MTTYNDIAHVLTQHRPALLDLPTYTQAAVALVLRAETDGLVMLFIERASLPDDPWSGDLGFPGGKVEEGESLADTMVSCLVYGVGTHPPFVFSHEIRDAFWISPSRLVLSGA